MRYPPDGECYLEADAAAGAGDVVDFDSDDLVDSDGFESADLLSLDFPLDDDEEEADEAADEARLSVR